MLDKPKPVCTTECATIFQNVSIRSQLHIVGLYAINVCPFPPLRSDGIPFTPVEAARNKSVKNCRDSPPASIPACPSYVTRSLKFGSKSECL